MERFPETGTGLLLGLLISAAKLRAVRSGRPDNVYCRYALYAAEIGARLCFFEAGGLDPTAGRISGFEHACGPDHCQWIPVETPVPRVIYDRCFGSAGRDEAARVRAAAAELGVIVINSLPKITKLQAFEALGGCEDLVDCLPFQVKLEPESLEQALCDFPDLYLKPDALSKGKGVYRLYRSGPVWILQSREVWGDNQTILSSRVDVIRKAVDLIGTETTYLIQEGIPLATFLGNRFDFRAMVQKDGAGRWAVTGLVARIAPLGSVITSPRSGGQVAKPELALAGAFPDRWEEILTRLQDRSLALAAETERRLGLAAELGLDLGITETGDVRLIEVNGKPLRVSLERLNDPLVDQRIYRFPIHYAAFLATRGED